MHCSVNDAEAREVLAPELLAADLGLFPFGTRPTIGAHRRDQVRPQQRIMRFLRNFGRIHAIFVNSCYRASAALLVCCSSFSSVT